DPERAVSVRIYELGAGDALTTIDAAWQRAQPGFARKPRHAPERPPPVHGWDGVTTVEYATASAEHRVVEALARSYAGVTYVALVDGDRAAYARREAELDRILWSLAPRGMRDESLAGKRPRVIDAARARELDQFI